MGRNSTLVKKVVFFPLATPPANVLSASDRLQRKQMEVANAIGRRDVSLAVSSANC